MKNSRTPRISANDQANLDRLESLGAKVDPITGAISLDENVFQGSVPSGEELDPEMIGSTAQVVSTSQTVSAFDRLDEGVETDLPTDEVADEVPPAPAVPEKKPEGLEKREADAREAQRQMSKTKLDLEKTMAAVNRRFEDLDAQIQKYAALQATVGATPPDLNPADAAVLSDWRENQPEAVSVMEAIAAPLYQAISQLREQLNAVVNRQGEFFSKLKEEEVFGKIYSKIPENKVKQISESPEFIQWLSDLPPAIRRTYINILNETSAYTSEDALAIFKSFSRDTGVDVGLESGGNNQPHHQPPPMDRAPSLRSGGALPEAAPVRRPAAPGELPPLSMEEAANFGQLMRDSQTPGERDILNKRLALTQLSFDGSGTTRTLR